MNTLQFLLASFDGNLYYYCGPPLFSTHDMYAYHKANLITFAKRNEEQAERQLISCDHRPTKTNVFELMIENEITCQQWEAIWNPYVLCSCRPKSKRAHGY
jgi:hypothetical protein